MKEFVVLKAYYKGKEFQGIAIQFKNEAQRMIAKKDCLYLFKNATCVNAMLVNANGDIYVRAKHGKIVKEYIDTPAVVMSVKYVGVFTNIDNIGITYERNLETNISTYRYVYDIMYKRINMWDMHITNAKRNALSLSGIRQIGKTTVLKQLYNTVKQSVFIDATYYNGSMRAIINLARKNGVKHIFIDEVCKLNEIARGELISLAKSGAKDVYFVFTGSVPYLVENIAESIVSCDRLELPAITYVERLAWTNNIQTNFESLKSVLKVTTHNDFIDWLKTGGVADDSLEYFRGVVQDTLTSYSGNDLVGLKDIFSKKNMSKDKMLNLLYYVAWCQLLYILTSKSNYNQYNNLPRIDNDDLEDAIKNKIIKLRHNLNMFKRQLTTAEITAFCDILVNARLARKVRLYSGADNKVLSDIKDSYGVSAYVFEYPQFISDYFGEDIGDMLLDHWVEYAILLKVEQVCFNVGKYRIDSGDSEIDVLYAMSEGKGIEKSAIEVKNKPCDAVNIRKYLSTELEDIQELVISCSDVRYKALAEKGDFDFVCRMRNDIIVVLLELALIERQYTSDKKKSIRLSELYRRYKVNN